MKELTMLVIFLLIAVSCFCQENFPRRAVVEGDTVVLVTPKQVTVMNLIILERDALEEELQLLRETLLTRDSILTIEKRKNSELWEVIKNKDRQVENLNLIIDTRDKQFKSREKVLQKKKWRNTILGVVVGGIIGILIAK